MGESEQKVKAQQQVKSEPKVKRILLVFGTRPEAIKMAPIVLAMREAGDFEPVVSVTAQHRVMLDQVLDVFGIRPDYDLDVIQDRQSLQSVTTRALERLSPLLERVKPDMVLVQGDTTSTFVGALAAFYHQMPVGHVEAGLRTGNTRSPYPEEMNRRLTSQLTDLHLAPTSTARDHLLAEGFCRKSIVVTGNTVIDALLRTIAMDVEYGEPALDDLDDHDGQVLLVTVHRRESWGEAMVGVGLALADIARAEPGLRIVFPIHRNPRVRESILPAIEDLRNVTVVEPMAYGGFARLMQRSTLILTDSGGIQEEGPSLGKPVLVMRDTTERPEAVVAGTVRLVGTDRAQVRDCVLELLRDPAAHRAMANAVNPYGDGQAVRRSLEAVRFFFGEGPPPDEFAPPSQAPAPVPLPS
ncbi:MAG TPA: UDP-N-acetylglucosamine 2-epimerase (non-hydrolyzing) [Acidimicrobiales bacterium]|nr:UDP-N-acetylglucosamine 2-epimerase (non-hydrolyzing) [Acidimicrobiales bacterium]